MLDKSGLPSLPGGMPHNFYLLTLKNECSLYLGFSLHRRASKIGCGTCPIQDFGMFSIPKSRAIIMAVLVLLFGYFILVRLLIPGPVTAQGTSISVVLIPPWLFPTPP